MTVTKIDLIGQVKATNPNMTKNQAREAVETILCSIKSSIENGMMSYCQGSGNLMSKLNLQGKAGILKLAKQ
jgi:nucleoid DNA-binding protein